MLDSMDTDLYVRMRIQELFNPSAMSNRLVMKCPLCGDGVRRNNFRGCYYPSSGLYSCFNGDCIANETAIPGMKFLSMVENKTYAEVTSDFMSSMGIVGSVAHDNTDIREFKEVVPVIQLSESIPSNWGPIPDDLNRDIIIRRKLKSAPFYPQDMQLYYDKLSKRIMIPWVRSGVTRIYQGMATDPSQTPKYLFDSNMDKDIFNYDMVDPYLGYIFALEGCWDTIWVNNGVTIGGTSITVNQQDIFDDFNCAVVYMLDNQWRDHTSMNRTRKLLEQGKTVWIWPSNIKEKDVNEYMMGHTKNPFESYNWMTKHIYSGIHGIMTLDRGGIVDAGV